ncbi:hypothetical protein DIS09_22305, partial [Burkholderia pseudomallei]
FVFFVVPCSASSEAVQFPLRGPRQGGISGRSAPVGPVGGSPHARRARVRPAARPRRRVTRPARASACA